MGFYTIPENSLENIFSISPLAGAIADILNK